MLCIIVDDDSNNEEDDDYEPWWQIFNFYLRYKHDCCGHWFTKWT